eukprot:TRINITY_DN4423_c0_g1_i1.p1 TRINITY_DN4423_c0_g1~~TRINITY_DN4423_c0_g1_i1.p1  ORF type:complete len:106 (+),score=5.10 TRINITY_DN4423_c0_g1_i1:1036-1353(+)
MHELKFWTVDRKREEKKEEGEVPSALTAPFFQSFYCFFIIIFLPFYVTYSRGWIFSFWCSFPLSLPPPLSSVPAKFLLSKRMHFPFRLGTVYSLRGSRLTKSRKE